MFTYNWKLEDLKKVPKRNINVFSCFSSSGGSTMGYKMNGCNVLGCCEICEKVINVYKNNFNPKYPFCLDIRELIIKAKNKDLPEELYNLDILDASPPCTTFSIAGSREKSWNKKKKFTEGYKEQRLDDLFFETIKLAYYLKPKICIFENVYGLCLGNAKLYLQEIIKKLNQIGYTSQVFVINGTDLGLPQKIVRVFIIAQQKEIFKKISLSFNEKPIYFKDIKDNSCKEYKNLPSFIKKLIPYIKPTDRNFSFITKRLYNKKKFFNYAIIHDNDIVPTITTHVSNQMYIYSNNRLINRNEIISISSFPKDYKCDNFNQLCWLCGMCVPPLMMYKIVREILKQTYLYEK